MSNYMNSSNTYENKVLNIWGNIDNYTLETSWYGFWGQSEISVRFTQIKTHQNP